MSYTSKPCDEPYFNVYPTRCLLRKPLPQNRLPSHVQPANIPEPPILGQGGGNQTDEGQLPEKGYDPTGWDLDQLKYEIKPEEGFEADSLARQESASPVEEKEGKRSSSEQAFWLDNPSVLLDSKYILEILPQKGMSENDFLNSLVRFSILTFLITFIALRRTEGIYFILIVMIATVLLKERSKKEGYPPFVPYPPDPLGTSGPLLASRFADRLGLNRENYTGFHTGNPHPMELPGVKEMPVGQDESMKNVEHYIFHNPREYIARKGPELVQKMLNDETRNQNSAKARENGGKILPINTKEGFTTYDASFYRPVTELTGELIERRNSQDTVQDPFCLDGRGWENIVGDQQKIRRKIYT